jgi:hypothetical protein
MGDSPSAATAESDTHRAGTGPPASA